ncbi:tRNA lysidine(34) synthetase TilS [Salinisphaera orenii]|uniref:tRNA lysidine(34) synthetase TilS n=1 Tax=Salinisphaera orenii TaxID=856731 RepID=UPI000DBE63F4
MSQLTDAFKQLNEDTRLVVAYSGGHDSTALLHVVSRIVPRNRLRALHVQHDLADRAHDWAAHCSHTCRALAIDLEVLPVATWAYRADGPEAAARRARYAALATHIAPDEWLVTAHHARDQAETMLLQALRGAGVAGTAAMPALAPLGAGWQWRPWRHVEHWVIADYVVQHGIDWIEDPSNADTALARGRLSETLWPMLTAAFPAAERTLARSASHAADAAEAMAALARIDLSHARIDSRRLSLAVLTELTPARRAAALRHWLAELGWDTPASCHIDEFERLLDARPHASPRVEFGHTELRVFAGAVWVMRRLGPAPSGSIDWHDGTSIDLPGEAGRLCLVGDGAARSPLTIDFRRGGERLARADDGTTRLGRWFYAHGWPLWLRERAPLVYAHGTLIAVADAWRHPEIDLWLGRGAGFKWCHELVGDPATDGQPPDS